MTAILVPVDGSDHSLKAIRIACDLAEKYGGIVALHHVLVHDRQAGRILELPVARNFAPAIVNALKNLAGKDGKPLPQNALRTIGESILKDAAGRVLRRGLDVENLPLGDGDPAESILLAAHRITASMIVMGCRGLTDVDSAAFGSVSQRVFRDAECTCISVK